MRGFTRFAAGGVVLAALVAACTSMESAPPDYAAIVAAPDRTDADKKNDERREPVKLLAFTGVRPGWKVLDMAAGGGYSTELMARGAAPNGVVYAQNPPGLPARAQDAFTARMQHAAMKNVVADNQPFDNPVPANVSNLDLVTFFFGYHDTTYLPIDRAKMDRALFNALKPGGILVIADYAAAPGAGTSVGKKFHRIEESALKSEVEAAGFKYVADGDFLRNPNDTHDFVIFNPKIPIDIFVVKFQKPS
jgi:predicted methyltransferase